MIQTECKTNTISWQRIHREMRWNEVTWWNFDFFKKWKGGKICFVKSSNKHTNSQTEHPLTEFNPMTFPSPMVLWKNTVRKEILHYRLFYEDVSDPTVFMSVIVTCTMTSYVYFFFVCSSGDYWILYFGINKIVSVTVDSVTLIMNNWWNES